MTIKMPKTIKFLIRLFRFSKKISAHSYSYTPTHRVAHIEKNDKDEYLVTIQLIRKNCFQKMAPEKLLADNNMVNQFSPTDIRTLTYLGYLGINSPKYRILAKRLSEQNDQMLFALHKKGEKKYSVVTANEISKNDEIISGLSQKEAHMIGITTASEQHILEKRQKEEILKRLETETREKIAK